MPQASWSAKDERMYEHIKDSAKGDKRKKEIAARTVNKKRAQEGRTKKAAGRRAASSSRTATRTRAARPGAPKRASTRRATARTTNRRGSVAQNRNKAQSRRRSGARSRNVDVKSMNVRELQARAKKLGIVGRSRMNKSQLLRAIGRNA